MINNEGNIEEMPADSAPVGQMQANQNDPV